MQRFPLNFLQGRPPSISQSKNWITGLLLGGLGDVEGRHGEAFDLPKLRFWGASWYCVVLVQCANRNYQRLGTLPWRQTRKKQRHNILVGFPPRIFRNSEDASPSCHRDFRRGNRTVQKYTERNAGYPIQSIQGVSRSKWHRFEEVFATQQNKKASRVHAEASRSKNYWKDRTTPCELTAAYVNFPYHTLTAHTFQRRRKVESSVRFKIL